MGASSARLAGCRPVSAAADPARQTGASLLSPRLARDEADALIGVKPPGAAVIPATVLVAAPPGWSAACSGHRARAVGRLNRLKMWQSRNAWTKSAAPQAQTRPEWPAERILGASLKEAGSMRARLLSALVVSGMPCLALAADLVPVVPPAPVAVVPATGIQGYAELSYGWINESYRTDFGIDEDYSYDFVGGAAVLNIPAGLINAQVEVRGTYYDPGSEGYGPAGGFAHLYWRDPAKGALGAFGGYQQDSGFDIWRGGAEALAFWGPFTLYGQAEYLDLSGDLNGRDRSGSGLQARLTGRYFVMPNLKLEASVIWSHLNWDIGDNELLSGIALAEYRFNSPLSGFVGLRYDDFDAQSQYNQYSYDDLTVFVGLRAYFGGDTLLGNDRNGAPFDTLDLFWDPPLNRV
jgi:hypothetical protein